MILKIFKKKWGLKKFIENLPYPTKTFIRSNKIDKNYKDVCKEIDDECKETDISSLSMIKKILEKWEEKKTIHVSNIKRILFYFHQVFLDNSFSLDLKGRDLYQRSVAVEKTLYLLKKTQILLYQQACVLKDDRSWEVHEELENELDLYMSYFISFSYSMDNMEDLERFSNYRKS